MLLTSIWIMAGLAAGLAALELAPRERRELVKWICYTFLGLAGSFAGGALGHKLQHASNELPVVSIMLSLVGAGALIFVASFIKYHREQAQLLKN
ncbi:MAG: hypothetical protein QM758_04935 [Armatimonas sp.]